MCLSAQRLVRFLIDLAGKVVEEVLWTKSKIVKEIVVINDLQRKNNEVYLKFSYVLN